MADLDYVGSIEIDKELMEASDILENEQVHVWNVTTGQRFVTLRRGRPSSFRGYLH